MTTKTFQSTRPRGTRRYPTDDKGRRHRFNPRVRAGRDFIEPPEVGSPSRFQSTRPRGTRPTTESGHCPPDMFQSTRPRGTRPESHYGRGGTGGFNPRVRAGRDPATRSIGTRVTFQSTRPRGTRLNLRVNHIRRQCVSIHASARDATYLGGVPSGSYRFQSTRPRGTRHIVLIVFPPCHWFQSTRPRGTRRYPDDDKGRRQRFNPRVRAGRDNPC